MPVKRSTPQKHLESLDTARSFTEALSGFSAFDADADSQAFRVALTGSASGIVSAAKTGQVL